MKTLLFNAFTTKHLLGLESEEGGFVKVAILIEGSQIKKIFNEDELNENEFEDIDHKINGNGHFLSPGLCDPQVHFREPGLEYKEDIESGSRAANKGGFTTVISMPNTTPTADNKETVSFMWEKSKEVGLCRVYPTGALSLGLKGEELAPLKELKKAGAIAITDDGKGVQSSELFLKALELSKELSLPVLDHSEDESLSLGGAIHKGHISKKYGVKGIDSNSEAIHVERGCELSERTGAHYHVLHVSTSRSIEAVRKAKKKGLNVTVEVSPHHLLLCDENIREKSDGTLDANWKMNPPLRGGPDRLSCVEALLDGTIDAIATDHAPHSPAEKNNPIEKAPFGIIGLETAFPLIYTNFVKTNDLSLNRCIDLMSKNAGNLFNLDIGRITEGSIADLALFDLENKFKVTEEYFASKSKNSPFIGEELFGQTKLTLFEGRVVYQDL